MYKITIEIPLALGACGALLTALVQSNYVIYRACYADLGYNQSDCEKLGDSNDNDTKNLEKEVDKYVAVMSTAKSVVESIITIIVCMFIGSISEKYGRRPILLICYIGAVLSSILLLSTTFLPNLSAWVIILYNVPGLITGSGPAVMTIIIAYITDTTTSELRAIRFVGLDLLLGLATTIGLSMGSYIFKAVGYKGTFGINLGFTGLAFIITYFLVPESLQFEKKTDTKNQMNNVFSISNIKELFQITFRKRDYFKREIISLLLFYAITSTLVEGESQLPFLFLRAKLGWTLRKYSLYSSICSGLSIMAVALTVYILYKKLHLKENVLMLIALTARFTNHLVSGFATQDAYIYAAGVINCFGGIVTPMTRTLMARLISQDEASRVFSLVMLVNFVFGLAATPMFNMIYHSTVDSNPAFYNFVGAGLFLFSIFITIVIMVLEKKMDRRIKEEESATP